MVDEFVLFEGGREVDWIDPLEELTETPTSWIVDNGYYVYTIPRNPRLTYTIRLKGGRYERR